jgi:hypothetical protein
VKRNGCDIVNRRHGGRYEGRTNGGKRNEKDRVFVHGKTSLRLTSSLFSLHCKIWSYKGLNMKIFLITVAFYILSKTYTIYQNMCLVHSRIIWITKHKNIRGQILPTHSWIWRLQKKRKISDEYESQTLRGQYFFPFLEVVII